MKLNLKGLMLMVAVGGAGSAFATGPLYVKTDAYRWEGDTVYQNEFKAWANSPYELQSTYKARPGYYMPVSQSWKRKNDLTPYPKLNTRSLLHQAVFNMALDEMVNAVEPDTTLRTGKEWAGVWTRDVSYSIILSMAYMQPEASMISLMKKVNPSGQIIQDTGSGGAWPISTDRMVWTLAAWEIYKVTGDRKWLEKVYPIVARSLEKDQKTVISENGLVKGETSFIDWREQSYPKWMQTMDISQSEAMGTNVMYAAALKAAGEMATVLGKKQEAAHWNALSASLASAIDKTFWMQDKGYYGMYTYGRDSKILNPRAETLGEALSILYDIAPAEYQKSISENNPQTPFGAAVFYPQIADMPSYHNNSLWPWVGAYWGLAQAKAGNEAGVMEAIGSIYRPAALFCTNKENFNLDNGDIFTELNSSNMLWCLAGNIAMTTRVLFGIHFEKDGLLIKPFVPEVMGDNRLLDGFNYRGATVNLTVKGFGARVKKLTLNGKELKADQVIPAKKLKGVCNIVVEMDNEPIPAMKLNRVPNVKAPWTPIAQLSNNPALNGAGVPVNNQLEWNPIEYIAKYIVLKDGKPVGETRQTSWPATEPGEWQVIGVSGDGVQSFASEPRSNRPAVVVEFPNEVRGVSSKEVTYRPNAKVEGFTGDGFVESEQRSAPAEVEVVIPEDGVYTVAVRYSNGNGPVNTENKAGVRTLMLDGVKVGTLVLPQRGVANWNDWGMSNTVSLPLKAGKHRLGVVYLPEDENMNIQSNYMLLDNVRIEKK